MANRTVSALFLVLILVCWASSASNVTFQFTVPIATVYGPGADAITNLVGVGMIGTGTVTYNPEAAGPDIDPSPNSAYFAFKGTDMKLSLTVGTSVFSSTDSSRCNLRVAYQLPSPVSDGLNYESNDVLLNGGPVPGATDSQTLDVALSTTNLQVLTSDALPTQPPQLGSFPFGGGNGFVEAVFYTYKSGVFDYGFSGTLTSITPVPTLSTLLTGGRFLISWPTNVPGFQLETTQTPEVQTSWTAMTSQPTNQNSSFLISWPVDVSTVFSA